MNKRVSFTRPSSARPNAEAWISGAGAESAPPVPPPPTPTKRLTIDIPEELHRRVKSGCAMRGEKIADVVRRYLDEEFPVG